MVAPGRNLSYYQHAPYGAYRGTLTMGEQAVHTHDIQGHTSLTQGTTTPQGEGENAPTHPLAHAGEAETR